MPITTLGQMEMMAKRNIRAAGEVAQAAAEAIEEIDTLKANKGETVSITIPITGWSSDSSSSYPQYYDIAVSEVTANDRAEITIAPGSIDIAQACGLCPTNETLAGKIRVRSTKIPTEAISAEYWLENGKE